MGYYAPNYSYGVRNMPDRNGLFPANAFIMRQAAAGQVFNSALQETSTGSERGIFSIQSAALAATSSTFLGSTTSANTSLTISVVENTVGDRPHRGHHGLQKPARGMGRRCYRLCPCWHRYRTGRRPVRAGIDQCSALPRPLSLWSRPVTR